MKRHQKRQRQPPPPKETKTTTTTTKRTMATTITIHQKGQGYQATPKEQGTTTTATKGCKGTHHHLKRQQPPPPEGAGTTTTAKRTRATVETGPCQPALAHRGGGGLHSYLFCTRETLDERVMCLYRAFDEHESLFVSDILRGVVSMCGQSCLLHIQGSRVSLTTWFLPRVSVCSMYHVFVS